MNEAKRSSEVSEQIEILGKILVELNDALSNLSDHLMPILRPIVTDDKVEERKEQCLVPLADMIRQESRKAKESLEFVKTINDSIEL